MEEISKAGSPLQTFVSQDLAPFPDPCSKPLLWIADRTDRVTLVDLPSGSSEEQMSPAGDWLSRTYRYVLAPFYRVCPKPGEFYKLVTYLSSTGESETRENIDLQKGVEQTDPWGPLKSGMGFMLVMLFFACRTFQLKDY